MVCEINANGCECGDPNCDGRDYKHEIALISDYGFLSHFIIDDPSVGPSMANLHTHGIPISQNHHDIQIVVAMPPLAFSNIAHSVYDYIREGNRIETNKEYSNFLSDLNVKFTWAIENDRDVLRMILPDQEGRIEKSEIAFPFVYQWMGTYDEPQTGIMDLEFGP